ncbi:MAG: hypothetical protein A3F09_00475 [Chlamydiae bacterium RIFCSPHIGHO2_12_FULL_49_11]|nr:MAG: hypothetical protein A3F09_00475 [Chlamydiae bacterium RIFCSPHIGHO2_12_FULL_49_11]
MKFDDFTAGFADALAGIPEIHLKPVESFLHAYFEILVKKGFDLPSYQKILSTFFETVGRQIENPYPFSPHHLALRTPVDYYTLGQEFFRPLVQFEKSTLSGRAHLHTIDRLVESGENVILLANHQIEADPQMISLMIEKVTPRLAPNLTFVAGERVVTDPLAVPLSLGRNLFCIYSKKYFEYASKEKKALMISHNQHVIHEIGKNLHEGGLCLYIASSGGRDRKNTHGKIPIAPFDPDSIALMELLAKKAKKPTHLFGLALYTYEILPPPQSLQVELGEQRTTSEAPIHIGFSPEIDLSKVPAEGCTKEELRSRKRDCVYEIVANIYNGFFIE